MRTPVFKFECAASQCAGHGPKDSHWTGSNFVPANYCIGYALDCFAEGLWALQPVHQNRVGLVLDAGMEKELQIRHLQVADAAKASLGLNVVEYIVTDTPLKVEKWIDPESGQSTGRINLPDSLLRAVETLVNKSQVNAIAVVGRFPDDDIQEVDDYRQGMGIDNLAGVEAVISHLVVRSFQIPCAHALALSPFPLSPSLCPKSAAKELGYTFLPCVLAGLNACGGGGALIFARSRKNKLQVSNYWEAIGVIAAHKAGVDPFSLRRDQISNIRCKSVPINGYSLSRERT
ncbi:hypothetical protein K1719_040551 [Acacia pycnantha]|nr:hypothetical protein K1719_040551 [Acacia pycnantha]